MKSSRHLVTSEADIREEADYVQKVSFFIMWEISVTEWRMQGGP